MMLLVYAEDLALEKVDLAGEDYAIKELAFSIFSLVL